MKGGGDKGPLPAWFSNATLLYDLGTLQNAKIMHIVPCTTLQPVFLPPFTLAAYRLPTSPLPSSIGGE